MGACLFALGMGGVVSARAAEIECPRTIVETPTVSGDMAGWQVMASTGERMLEQVDVFLGEPAQRAAQVPDARRRVARRETLTWRLRRKPGDVFHVACGYAGTTVLLWRAIADEATRCEASYELLPNGRHLRLRRMVCR